MVVLDREGNPPLFMGFVFMEGGKNEEEKEGGRVGEKEGERLGGKEAEEEAGGG